MLAKPFAQGYLLKLMHIFFYFFFIWFQLFFFWFTIYYSYWKRERVACENVFHTAALYPHLSFPLLHFESMCFPLTLFEVFLFSVFGRCCATCDGTMLDVVSPNPPHHHASKTVSVPSVSCHPLFGRSFSTTGLRCRGRSSSSSRIVVFVNVYVQNEINKANGCPWRCLHVFNFSGKSQQPKCLSGWSGVWFVDVKAQVSIVPSLLGSSAHNRSPSRPQIPFTQLQIFEMYLPRS